MVFIRFSYGSTTVFQLGFNRQKLTVGVAAACWQTSRNGRVLQGLAASAIVTYQSPITACYALVLAMQGLPTGGLAAGGAKK